MIDFNIKMKLMHFAGVKANKSNIKINIKTIFKISFMNFCYLHI